MGAGEGCAPYPTVYDLDEDGFVNVEAGRIVYSHTAVFERTTRGLTTGVKHVLLVNG